MRFLIACFGLCLSLATPPGLRATTPIPQLPFPANLTTNAVANPVLTWNLENVNLLPNSGFESGNLSSWSSENQGFGISGVYNATTDPPGPEPPSAPMEGNFSFLQFGFQGQFAIFQQIALPPNARRITLQWALRILNYTGEFSNDPNGSQGSYVQVRNVNNTPLAVVFATEPGDEPFQPWGKRFADLTAFSGQTVRIVFITAAGLGQISVYLDRMSLVAELGSAVTNEVSFHTNATFAPSHLVASTTNTYWTAPSLDPNTTYFWRVITRSGPLQNVGPTWRFTTGARGPVSRFEWNPIPSPQAAGTPIPVTLTARDSRNFVATNFTGSVSLLALRPNPQAPAQSLLPNDPFIATATYEGQTVGYAFTPSSPILVSALRGYSGDRFSLWNGQGQLLARQVVPILAPGWTELPLASPVLLQADQSYRLGVYSQGPRTQFLRFDGPQAFGHGTLDQAYVSDGDTFPVQAHSARWWFLDLVYHDASSTTLPVSPPASGNFQNGVWSGLITLPSSGTAPLILQAAMQAGAIGFSNPIAILGGLRILDIRVDNGQARLRFQSTAGKQYRLQRVAAVPPPSPDSWDTVLDQIQGTGDELEVADPGPSQATAFFYRLEEIP